MNHSQLLLEAGTDDAVARCVDLLLANAANADLYEFNLALCRHRYRRSRQGAPLRLGICGWEMAHNAAGRVRSLADIAAPLAGTEVIGATFARWGKEIWPPLRGMDIPCHLIHVEDEARFPAQALDLVRAHPFDMVILSKPRLPNILFGLLYKLVWGARVVLDIDDEELGAVQAETPLTLAALRAAQGEASGESSLWRDLGGKDWTRAAVGLWDHFDGTTVSNPALQARYGGPILPHARDGAAFVNSPDRKAESRRRHGIPQDRTVVLFFGTPRRHKGVVETARAIAQIGRPDLCFVIVGDFPDAKLRAELAAMSDADIRFLPGQPYDAIADTVAMGDICVLMQRQTGLLAQHQFPAKLVDALAMELLVLAQPTPAIAPLVEAGAVVPVGPQTLADTLRDWLDRPEQRARTVAMGRAAFEQDLSLDAARAALAPLLGHPPNGAPGTLFADPRLRALFDRLGGWRMFTPQPAPAAPGQPEPEAAPTPAPTPAPLAAPAIRHSPDRGMPDKTLVVYSVLVGDYEPLKEPEALDPAARYILFTDNPDLTSEGWEVMPFDTLGLSPRRAARLPKLLPHRYLPPHEASLYVDASLTMRAPDVVGLMRKALSGSDIAAYPHFERDCVHEEIAECLALGKLDPVTAEPFAESLRAEGFPAHYGLLENAFLLRRDTPAMRLLNDRWHEAFATGPERDQLHLMPLLWRSATPWRALQDAPQFRKSPHVRFKAHTGAPAPVLALPGPRRRINWVIGGPSSIGWAYENNARRLIAQMPEFDHAINAETPSDCAVYFDTIIHQKYRKPADRAVLRLGGPNPVRRIFGEDPEAVAEGLSAFDAIIPLSGELRRLASGASALVRMMPNGLDLAQYRPAAPDRPANASFTIGFAANCKNAMERAFKGLDLLEEAVARTGARLVTLQKGTNQIPHERMVPDFYHRIDCLVHPVGPGKEGCSNVIMEALACGVPVITTRESGYHGEQLVHGATVLFCERNVESLAEQIARLRDDPALRARLARNGARFARTHHDLADTGRQVRRVLQETIAPGSLLPLQRPRLRIAMITKTFWPKFAGMELMVHNLATALQHMGNDVVLFARSYKERYDEIAHDYTLQRYDPVFPALHAAFGRHHRERPFDAIYVQGAYQNASMAHRLKEEFGLPVLLRTHGEDIQIDPSINYGFRLDPKVDAEITDNLRRADVNVSISRHILRDAQGLAPDTDQRMISNGVDANHFDRPRNRHLHERFDLPPGTRVLLMVGRNVMKKTFHLAIEALARVREKRKDVVLVHVGKDGNGENLRQAAERAGVSAAFFEYGEANYYDMPDIYAGADIFVFPSKLETFGNVTVEAMAAGLPCVEFDYGANRDKIVHGTTGYVVPHGDTRRMAARVLRLLDDPKKMASSARAAKRHIRQRFDWPIIARQYHDAFLDHTLRRARPGTLKPRLRIAFAADKMIRIRGGGGEKSLTTLVNAMAQRGHEVVLVIKEPGVARHEAPFYPLHPGVRLCNIYGWDAEKPAKGNRPALLKAILARIQPDVVVGFFLPEFGYIARGCEGLDVPLLLSHRNDPAEKLQNLTERYPARLPDVAYADERAQVLTVQMEPYLNLLPPVARPKGVVIPNSVLTVPEAMLASPEKPARRNVILNVARLVGAKHQDLMIRAFARIAANHPDWDIHIWGDGPLQPQIEALIADLGLQDRVLLKGTTQDILPVYRDAKIFAFPSLYEGFSRALSEAMAHGLPSVGIDSCICSAVFLRESGGGIVTPDETTAFAAALDRLIRSPEERRAMGKKARHHVAHFAPAKVDDSWEKALFEAISRYAARRTETCGANPVGAAF